MQSIELFKRRWTREQTGRLNDMAGMVESLTLLGTGSAPGEELPTYRVPRVLARITGVLAPAAGYLNEYSYQILAILPVNNNNNLLPLWSDTPEFNQSYLAAPAFEMGNNPYVPVDGSAIVEMFPGPIPAWTFKWDETCILAKLTAEGSPAKYAFSQYYATSGGTLTLLPGGITGTTTENFAKEINGTTGLTNSYAILFRAACSGYAQAYGFIQVPGGNGYQQQQGIVITDAIGGTFTITLDISDPANPTDPPNQLTTGPIAWNVDSTDLKTALAVFDPTCTVSGSGTVVDPFIVLFSKTINYSVMACDSSGLQGDQEWTFSLGTGGAASSITITDGTVTYNNTTILQFPGGTITQPGGAGTPVIYTPSGEHDINAWKASGQWYTINNSEGLADFNPNALVLYGVPVIVTNAFTFTDLGFFLYPDPGGGAYAVNGRIVLYSAASFATITPTNLIVGPTNMTFVGWPGGMKGTGLTATIGPGLYWVLVAFDASGLNMQAAVSTVSPLPMMYDGTRMVQAKALAKSTAYPPTFPGLALTDFSIDPTIALAWKF